MLLDHIDRLRREPRGVRKRVAFTYASACTGVIVLVWLSVLFGGKQIGQQDPSELSSTRQDEAPMPAFSDIKKVFSTSNLSRLEGQALSLVGSLVEKAGTTTGATTTIATTDVPLEHASSGQAVVGELPPGPTVVGSSSPERPLPAHVVEQGTTTDDADSGFIESIVHEVEGR